MMLFAQQLNCEGIQFLSKNGSDINITDSMGRNMLHYLVQNDDTGEATERVMETYGETLEIDAMTKGGVTPLMLGVKRNNSKAVQALLNARANPFYCDQLG